MNINNLTIGQAKELAALFGVNAPETDAAPSAHVGQKCVIRCYASGVHFGTVTAHHGKLVCADPAPAVLTPFIPATRRSDGVWVTTEYMQ